ncbi:right-handed parallel beta-helix repeat-containing protein [Halorubellus sp. PRR65]|uniref:right-handed parallel beta-helix repeat-containing protein n=1 Tax=Halorubellus sp. PRR65 TaxID=3098148 RepID=UPI002B25DF25|nr:right-handed parallel beta-helix repeat-containing protein [Halorubellus sp. PRR65]
MQLPRRDALAVAGSLFALAGCSSPGRESVGMDGGRTGGSPGATTVDVDDPESVSAYFEDGNLVAPVDNDSVSTRNVNGVRYATPTGGSGRGENAPPSADPYTLDESALEGFQGRFVLHRGRWVTSGLATDASLNWDDCPVYVEGDGVWATAVEHVDGSTPTVTLQAAKGNGGGVRNVALYGAGMDVGDAPILEAGPNPYDHVIENAIVRHGGSDAVRVHASGSGTRVTNCWLENCPGRALRVDDGSRVKVDNVHVTGTGGGVAQNGTHGNFSNLTVFDLHDGVAFEFTSPGNVLTNFVAKKNLSMGVRIASGGRHTTVSSGYVADVANAGLFVGGRDATVSDVAVENWGTEKGWAPLVRLMGAGSTATNLWGVRSSADASTTLARVEADHCRILGLGGDPAVDWQLFVGSDAVHAVLDSVYGVDHQDIVDEGTRTLVNRWGTNDGDPNETGEWHGYAEYAGTMNATVWDVTSAPWTPYRATPDGGTWLAST